MAEPGRSEAFDIYVVGLGAVGVSQITREAEQAIGRSRTVYFVDNALGVAEHLSTLCANAVDLMSCYRRNERRAAAYDRMVTMVIAGALEAPPVTFAVYGHPSVYVYPTRQILEAAGLLDLRCQMLPGISTVDAIFCELGLDPGLHGLQMYEANDAICRSRPLQPDVPCLLLQVGTLETGLASAAKSRPERLDRLARYLSQFYPESHTVAIVTLATCRIFRSRIVSFALGEMREHAQEFTLEATLYIPPVRLRPVVYTEFVADMERPSHLETLTLS
jgi:uncharacterized protein YabN with tetrapyrrole methylase and pyrophosphatase domain